MGMQTVRDGSGDRQGFEGIFQESGNPLELHEGRPGLGRILELRRAFKGNLRS